jgi:phage major head subunit gpT-like protein
MLVNLDKVQNAQRVYRTGLFKAFSEAPVIVEPIALVQQIETGEVEVIASLVNTAMREMLGERVVKSFTHEKFIIALKEYENTIGVPVKDFEDDKWNLYMPKINGMGLAAAVLKSRLVAGILEGTLGAKGYDGLALGADAHPTIKVGDSSTTYDNLVTTVLSRAAYETAKTNYFATLVDDSGDPAGISPTHIVVKLDSAADIKATELFEASHIFEDSVMKPNPYQNKLKIIRNPYIVSGTFWAMLCLDRPDSKPVLLYPRYAQPEFTALTDPESDHVFKRREYLFGTYYRVAAAVGNWMLAYISTGTG